MRSVQIARRPPKASDGYEFNHPRGSLPPVDCPLIVKLPRGTTVVKPNKEEYVWFDELVRAERREHLQQKGGQMTYYLDEGGVVTGRLEWTYP